MCAIIVHVYSPCRQKWVWKTSVGGTVLGNMSGGISPVLHPVFQDYVGCNSAEITKILNVFVRGVDFGERRGVIAYSNKNWGQEYLFTPSLPKMTPKAPKGTDLHISVNYICPPHMWKAHPPQTTPLGVIKIFLRHKWLKQIIK